MTDLAPINKQLKVLNLMPVEDFYALYDERFQDTPHMQQALNEWKVDHRPIQLQKLVGQRLESYTTLSWRQPPSQLDELIFLLEDDDRRTVYLAELYKIRIARQLRDWCHIYFLHVHS